VIAASEDGEPRGSSPNAEGARTTPSVVAFTESGERLCRPTGPPSGDPVTAHDQDAGKEQGITISDAVPEHERARAETLVAEARELVRAVLSR
jgi:hypothetical protein